MHFNVIPWIPGYDIKMHLLLSERFLPFCRSSVRILSPTPKSGIVMGQELTKVFTNVRIRTYTVINYFFFNSLLSGQERNISEILLADLLPQTELYMTYEGSLTQPGCQETVTWILLNKPLYVTKDQVNRNIPISKTCVDSVNSYQQLLSSLDVLLQAKIWRSI